MTYRDLRGYEKSPLLARDDLFLERYAGWRLASAGADLFDAIDRGFVKADIGQRFRLDDIVEVHTAAQERRVAGAIVIVP